MSANQCSKCGWSVPRQYATFLAIAFGFLVLTVTFVSTVSPVAWEKASFTPPSAYAEKPTMIAAALEQARAEATIGIATVDTDR